MNDKDEDMSIEDFMKEQKVGSKSNDITEISKEKFFNWSDGRKKRNSELSVSFTPIKGRTKIINAVNPIATIYQQRDGLVYFNKDDSVLYELLDYVWEGPRFKTVSKTNKKSKGEGKTKRTGRVTGAIVGSIITPGVGTVVGAMKGTGNKKHESQKSAHSVTHTEEKEVSTPASIKVRNIQTGEIILVTFKADTKMNNTLAQLSLSNQYTEQPQIVVPSKDDIQTNDPYEELKKVKELLDMGIITEEEFEIKKKELLGL